MKLRFSALGQKRIVFFLSSGDLWGLAREYTKNMTIKQFRCTRALSYNRKHHFCFGAKTD